MYIEDKQRESAAATIRSHRSRLGHFLQWCDEESIDNMNDLTARRAHEFRVWRRTERGDPNSVTMKTQMDTFRVFARWCETIDAVPENLSEKILSPQLGKHENERGDMLDPDVGDDVFSSPMQSTGQRAIRSSLLPSIPTFYTTEREEMEVALIVE